MQYEILGEKISDFEGFKQTLSDAKVSDSVLLAELDRLYNEWKSEEDFYFFLEEECLEKFEALKQGENVFSFFRCLIGDGTNCSALLEKLKQQNNLKECKDGRIGKLSEERYKLLLTLNAIIRCHLSKVVGRVENFSGVQLWEGGPHWAEKNIGAVNPFDFGHYFWWGDAIGCRNENNTWIASDGISLDLAFNNSIVPIQCDYFRLQDDGWITSDGVLVPEHDTAHVKWGGDWRMPTKSEFYDLINKCDWIWTMINGVNGYIVRGRNNYVLKNIFLPCAGNASSFSDCCSFGNYWSSCPNSDSSFAWSLGFTSGYRDTFCYSRSLGMSVRPIHGFIK